MNDFSHCSETTHSLDTGDPQEVQHLYEWVEQWKVRTRDWCMMIGRPLWTILKYTLGSAFPLLSSQNSMNSTWNKSEQVPSNNLHTQQELVHGLVLKLQRCLTVPPEKGSSLSECCQTGSVSKNNEVLYHSMSDLCEGLKRPVRIDCTHFVWEKVWSTIMVFAAFWVGATQCDGMGCVSVLSQSARPITTYHSQLVFNPL